MGNKLAIVYTTISSYVEAEKLAELAVSSKHAACVNILQNTTSVYEWEGKLEKVQECIMIFKTCLSKAESLRSLISANHPYSIPAILYAEVNASDSFIEYVGKQMA